MNNAQSIYFENPLIRVDKKKNTYIISAKETGEIYLLDEMPVKEVFFASKRKLVILVGHSSIELHASDGVVLESSLEFIKDYYYDELSESFFRQDKDEAWVDLHGYKMPSNFVLKGDVLISLSEKVSKQSLSFVNGTFYCDTQGYLVQINKLVFNRKLERIKINESKVLSIGKESLRIAGEDYQQVFVGLEDAFFISKKNGSALNINGLHIKELVSLLSHRSREIITLATENELLSIDGLTGELLTKADSNLVIQDSAAIELTNQSFVHALLNNEQVVYNLDSKELLYVETPTKEICSRVEYGIQQLGSSSYCHLHTNQGRFTVDMSTSEILTTSDGEYIRALDEDSRFSENLVVATLDTGDFVLYAEDFSYVMLDGDRRINRIGSGELLLEVIAEGRELIADARKGITHLTTAYSGADQIIERSVNTHYLGNSRLMNVKVKTYGGKASRVVKLDSENLEKFTLPGDLRAFPDRKVTSVFSSAIVCEIDFESELEVDENIFYSAEFVTFTGAVNKVILAKSTGRPLHFEGLGHKMELAFDFRPETINRPYYLGENRMIGVKTVDENLKINELMFSMETMSSQIMFLDSYLPVIKRPHGLDKSAKWDYVLYQLRGLKSEVEFLVAENDPPYRILVHKAKNKMSPKFVKSSKKILKTPEEVNYIKKILMMDPGFLVEVS